MIAFKGGRFRMGDLLGNGLPYENPSREVQVAPFALGRYEISNGEWQACVASGGCEALPGADDPARAHYPVTHVNWNRAVSYTQWLTHRTGKPYRLPSEAEWEYAARAGTPWQYTWGNLELEACAHANTLDRAGLAAHPQWTWNVDCNDGFAESAPVGSFTANAWGLYDMLGNVWEWVADCWHSDYTGAPTDGRPWIADGDCSKRVNRGGGWGNNPRSMRVSARDADPADASSDALGFRIALSLAEAAP